MTPFPQPGHGAYKGTLWDPIAKIGAGQVARNSNLKLGDRARVMTDRVINSESPPRVINRLLTTRIYPHQPASTLVAPGAVNLRCGHFTAAIPYRRSYRRSGSRPSESLAGPPPSIPASTSPMSTSSKRSPTSAGFFRALLDVQWPSRSSGAV